MANGVKQQIIILNAERDRFIKGFRLQLMGFEVIELPCLEDGINWYGACEKNGISVAAFVVTQHPLTPLFRVLMGKRVPVFFVDWLPEQQQQLQRYINPLKQVSVHFCQREDLIDQINRMVPGVACKGES